MKKLYPLFFIFCLGCAQPEPVKVKVALVASKSTLSITGIDSLILNDIDRDSAANWESIFPVYSMPVDTEMKDFQEEQPGVYRVEDGVLFFKPDTPFKARQTYFLRYYDYSVEMNAWHFIKNKSHKSAPRHIDLIFTP